MPFARPTLADLVDRVRGDFKSRLSLVGSVVRRRMADVLASVWAGTAHLFHGHLEFISEQIFADRSEREFLLRQASLYGLAPTPATFSSGTVLATGTPTSPIPLGAILVRDDAATYVVTLATVIGGGGSVSVEVDAVVAGIDGDMETGETLAFESPLTGVDATVTVEAPGLAGGFDEESTEEFRDRFLLFLQDPPQGGADSDYEAWALEVAGVTRAWVYPLEDGLGTVTVRFVLDGSVPIFPTAPDITAVQTKLDEERPITAEATAKGVSDLAVAFTISITPDTAANRVNVENELDDLMFRDGEPGDGVSRGTIKLSQMQIAIGVAEGIDDFTLTVPAADVVPALGELPSVGVITWV
jgi:uncharacterized phage protein gp47/JayE